MAKISVVINTLNDAKNLDRALKSVAGFADEIVVCDMESTDNSVSVTKKYKAKVYKHKRELYVEKARNFAVGKTTGDWIFVIDADEEVPPSLAQKIKSTVAKGIFDYYRIPRKNIIFGKWIKHARWWPDYNIRLFKKGKVSWNEIIHAVPMTEGKGGQFDNQEKLAITHFHYSSLSEYVNRLNRYTEAQSQHLVHEKYDFSWKDLVIKPSNEFFSRYFFGQGYKDGLHGLALSLLQAFSELVLYLKVWEKNKFKQKDLQVDEVIDTFKDQVRELHFWENDTLFRLKGDLIYRIKRKLKI